MKFDYGASFNCEINGPANVGAGEEGSFTLDYVGNDLNMLTKRVIEDSVNEYVAVTDHPLVGCYLIEGGDEVVAVLVDVSDRDYVITVVFKNPDMPTIVE